MGHWIQQPENMELDTEKGRVEPVVEAEKKEEGGEEGDEGEQKDDNQYGNTIQIGIQLVLGCVMLGVGFYYLESCHNKAKSYLFYGGIVIVASNLFGCVMIGAKKIGISGREGDLYGTLWTLHPSLCVSAASSSQHSDNALGYCRCHGILLWLDIQDYRP